VRRIAIPQPFGGRAESVARLCEPFEGRVLYVGARESRFDFSTELRAANSEVTVVEAWEENALHLSTIPWLFDVVHGDVRTVSLGGPFDSAIWWHGPEHVRVDEVAAAVARLEAVATRCVLLGCPWGQYEQGVEYGNPHERHESHLSWELFESLGYDVECLGNEHEQGSCIVAAKRLA
jgi:hypothetical protein